MTNFFGIVTGLESRRELEPRTTRSLAFVRFGGQFLGVALSQKLCLFDCHYRVGIKHNRSINSLDRLDPGFGIELFSEPVHDPVAVPAFG